MPTIVFIIVDPVPTYMFLDLKLSTTFFLLQCEITTVPTAKLIFVGKLHTDAAGGKASDFREFLVILLLHISPAIACA